MKLDRQRFNRRFARDRQVAGAIQGQSTSSNGAFASADARDFNLEGLGINDATINGSYVSRQSLAGTVTYSNQSVTFNGSYSTLYDAVPSLAAVAGTYSGAAAVLAGTESATVTIAANGALSGVGASGCQFTGSATPRATGNVYNVSVTFGGGVCSNGSSTVTGIGVLDASGKRLYGTALNSGRTNGFIFVGTKP